MTVSRRAFVASTAAAAVTLRKTIARGDARSLCRFMSRQTPGHRGAVVTMSWSHQVHVGGPSVRGR